MESILNEYILRQKATVAAPVVCRPIYELYTGEELMPISSRMMRWWYQDVGSEEEEPVAKCGFNLIL